MSRAYREMVERFPELYSLTEDYRQRFEHELAEHEAWLRDRQAQEEYLLWDEELNNTGEQS